MNTLVKNTLASGLLVGLLVSSATFAAEPTAPAVQAKYPEVKALKQDAKAKIQVVRTALKADKKAATLKVRNIRKTAKKNIRAVKKTAKTPAVTATTAK